MSVTLTVTDNQDGTGGVATIAGSNGGTVSLYYLTYLGLQQGYSWVLYGTRTGDGTIAVSLAVGLYFWYCTDSANNVSTLVFQQLSNTGLQSVHYRSMLAVQTRIQGLGLSGLASNKVVIQWLPRVWDDIDNLALPLVMIAPLGKEGQPGILNNRDDIDYPIVVAIVDRQNEDYQANLQRNTRWREQIFRALRHQRLLGVPEIITTDVEPDFVINPEIFNKNLWYSALLTKPRSREARG